VELGRRGGEAKDAWGGGAVLSTGPATKLSALSWVGARGPRRTRPLGMSFCTLLHRQPRRRCLHLRRASKSRIASTRLTTTTASTAVNAAASASVRFAAAFCAVARAFRACSAANSVALTVGLSVGFAVGLAVEGL
jgi:hypothetical protein